MARPLLNDGFRDTCIKEAGGPCHTETMVGVVSTETSFTSHCLDERVEGFVERRSGKYQCPLRGVYGLGVK